MVMLIPGVSYPQHYENISSHTEELLFTDETSEVPEEVLETLLELMDHPVNLNNATPGQLEESGIFTPFQVQSIIRYREAYGPLYSVYELAALAGFRHFPFQEVIPCLRVDNKGTSNLSHPGREIILFTASRVFPESAGYQPREDIREVPAYIGSPVKTNIRIKKNIRPNISLGLSYDKDPGEKYLNGLVPEFISGYLNFRGTSYIKQLIIGDFQLHHGMGLVNGRGFMRLSGNHPFEHLSISRLIPYASLNENRFEQGIAGKIGLQHMEFLLWGSYKPMDLSLNSSGELTGENHWNHLQRKSGLHRTTREINGRFLGYRMHAGLQAVVRQERMAAGFMAGIAASGLSGKGLDSLKLEPEPYFQNVISAHGQWHCKHADFFGEAAFQNCNAAAVLGGIKYRFNAFLQAKLLVHHYGPSYEGIQPASYASGSLPGNESGLAASFHLEPGRFMAADFQVELFSYPSPRFQTNVPSSGWRSSLSISHTGTKLLQWKFRVVRKAWQATSNYEGPGIRPLGHNHVTKMDFRTTFDPHETFSWHSRFVVTLLTGKKPSGAGWAFIQRLGPVSLKFLNFTSQFVVFHVPEYENRIYLYEPGMYYGFNFPMYYGIGQKVTSMVTLRAGKRISLSGRASVISYHDRENIGSGYDQLTGRKKWEMGLQLRINP